MTKYKLEYVWLDGYTPVPNLRGKTQIKEYDSFPSLEQLPLWGFDGSSTKQAEGRSSDCVLKPVRVFLDSERTNGAIVLCEVMMPDGVTPHPSNKRATILDDEGAWFGFEQEYFFYKDGRPLAGSGADGLADFSDLMKETIEKYPDLFAGTGVGGGGATGRFSRGAGSKVLTRSQFEAIPHKDRAAKIREGFTVVDG